MTLQQLRYAIGIAETGSFNKAAEKLYISQPSLTAAIKDLEDELNILIFNRTSRGVKLTSEGEEFVAYARELYHHYESVLDKYGKIGKRKKKFGVSTQHYSFAVKSFVETVKLFDTDKYEFAIRETRTKEVIEDVASFKSDIGILYIDCPSPDIPWKQGYVQILSAGSHSRSFTGNSYFTYWHIVATSSFRTCL